MLESVPVRDCYVYARDITLGPATDVSFEDCSGLRGRGLASRAPPAPTARRPWSGRTPGTSVCVRGIAHGKLSIYLTLILALG